MQRILIADDHTVVRLGIKQILSIAFPLALIEDVTNAEDLLKKVTQEKWDVVISDISMPGRNGLEMIPEIRKVHPGLPVLILSMYSEEHYGLRAIKAGASGYLMKEMAAGELVIAVKKVLAGKKYISPVIAEKLASAIERNQEKSPYQNLSNRELQVFKMIADGNGVSDIASKLSIKLSTVSTYRARIMEKMHLKSNADLIRYAFENKLL